MADDEFTLEKKPCLGDLLMHAYVDKYCLVFASSVSVQKLVVENYRLNQEINFLKSRSVTSVLKSASLHLRTAVKEHEEGLSVSWPPNIETLNNNNIVIPSHLKAFLIEL